MNVRTHPDLYFHFDYDAARDRRVMVMEHLSRGTRFRLPTPSALQALDAARDWMSRRDLVALLADSGLRPDRSERFVSDGIRDGWLQSEADADADDPAERWRAAGCAAAYRLKQTKSHQHYLDYRAEDALAADVALMSAYRAEAAPPPIFKDDPDRPIEDLAKPAPDSQRPTPSTRDWLAGLLWNAFAKTGSLSDDIQGELLLKPHPSGGARHPVECYLVCRRVTGLAAGVYHYSVRHHHLARLDVAPDQAAERIFGANAPDFIVLLTVIPERVMWRYREPTSFGVMMLDAGHALENFAMLCRADGLRHRVATGMDGPALTELFGFAAFQELPAAALGIGGR